jgi:hypothetical protein
MSLLAEEIVEEWLNRRGYFTIKGIRLGVHEIDLLAVKLDKDGVVCKHIEVQASMRPVSYVTAVPKAIQNATGRAALSAKERTKEELRLSVEEWIDNKFRQDRKVRLRQALHDGDWEFELVVHLVRHAEELQQIEEMGIAVRRLASIVAELARVQPPGPERCRRILGGSCLPTELIAWCR